MTRKKRARLKAAYDRIVGPNPLRAQIDAERARRLAEARAREPIRDDRVYELRGLQGGRVESNRRRH